MKCDKYNRYEPLWSWHHNFISLFYYHHSSIILCSCQVNFQMRCPNVMEHPVRIGPRSMNRCFHQAQVFPRGRYSHFLWLILLPQFSLFMMLYRPNFEKVIDKDEHGEYEDFPQVCIFSITVSLRTNFSRIPFSFKLHMMYRAFLTT